MKNTFTTTLALMKNIRWHPLLLLFLTCNYTLVPLIPQKKPRIHVKLGNNYVYFGDLHNHTELSDGSGTPRMAYDYTRYNAGLDFFAITDHDFVTSDNQMTHEKWQLIKATADSCNHDSEFVALWGFEWTSWTYNHCSVIGTDDFCSCDDTATNTFTKFCNWLSRREAYAFFNHPGRVGPPLESNLYASEPIEQFVGMELWNKSQRFDYYYYNDGLIPNDNNKSYYDEALSRGWRIGASGAGDNHWATWGTAVDCRMGILAPALTRKDILGALEARRFFSTLDKNIALSFTADSLEMGSIVHGRKHTFRVHALDGDKEPFSKVMLFNSNHDTIATWNPDPGPVSITFEDTVISDGYYYVKVSQPDGDEAISSPIWYFCSGTFNKGTSPDTPPTPDLPQIPDHTPKPCSTVVQPEFTSGYNYYFGNFHNHTNLSDGMGTPQEAYDYARYTAHLDFFGLSDHCYALNDDKWRITKATADSCNEDSSYVTLWGFEWTSSLYGHCSVVGSEDYCTVSDTATDSFTELLDWLATREGYAFFNHPGSRVFSDSLFNRFSGPPSDKFVGLDLWNKTSGFLWYYFNDGMFPNDNDKSFYDEALSRGWRIGATGSGDNHNGDWGTATDSRIGIPAPALTRDEIRSALGARRFYSTLDRNIQLSFKADSSEMGSTVAGCSHRFSISARDGDDESFTEVFLYNSNHDTVATWYPEPGPFTISFDMTVRANDYFYVRIAQEDGGGAISSPIWVSCSGTAEQDP